MLPERDTTAFMGPICDEAQKAEIATSPGALHSPGRNARLLVDASSPLSPSTLGDRKWPIALASLALCLALIIGCYWNTASAMVSIWARSDTFAHGFLVLPIVLWLIWRRRRELSALAPKPAWTIIAPFLAAGFAWLLGEFAAVNAVTQFALVAMIVLAVPFVLGMRVARSIAFPLAFLFFAVPIGEFALPRLMDWTADFTVLAVRASGVPVYREGLQFVIPSGTWSVVEACSGVRYLIASLMVGALYAYLSYRSPSRRLLFLGFAAVVPIVANWLRAYMIVMIGHLSGNTLAVGVDHLIYGWVFFGIVMVLMFSIAARWREDLPGLPLISNAIGQATVNAGFAPGKFRPEGERRSTIDLLAAAAIVSAITIMWPVAYQTMYQINAAPPPVLQALALQGAWSSSPDDPFGWQPAYQSPPAQVSARYRNQDGVVGLFIGYYRNQDHTRKLVSSENVLVKSLDREWAEVSRGLRRVDIDGKSLDVATAELRAHSGQRLRAWRWYWINGRLTANDYLAKAYTAVAELEGHGDDSAVIIIYTASDERGQADARLTDFTQANAGAIGTALQQTRDAR